MKTLSRFLLMLLVAVFAVSAQAQDKPRWAIRGIGGLNGDRTNKTYKFVKFETFGGDLAQLRNEATQPLVEYLAKTHGLNADDATVKTLSSSTTEVTLPNDPDGSMKVQHEYTVTFKGADGAPDVSYNAMLVDEYASFDENVDMTYDYTLYQLFAVGTEADTQPIYDDYSFTRSYNAKAGLMSLVPGMGQFYKGQPTKGWCILGAEAFFAGMGVFMEIQRHKYSEDAKKCLTNPGHGNYDSYVSKTESWEKFRNGAIGCFAAVYIYNLCDAFFSKGPRQVVVKKASGNTALSFGPTMVYDPSSLVAPAVGLTYTF